MHFYSPREPSAGSGGPRSFANPPAPTPSSGVPEPRARSTRGAPHAPTSPRKQPSAVRDSMPLAVTHPQLRIRVALCWGQGPPAEMAVSVGSCSSLVVRARLAGPRASATSWSPASNCTVAAASLSWAKHTPVCKICGQEPNVTSC